MAPLHSLGKDAQNEVQHDIYLHLMPLTSASLDTNGITNSTTLMPAPVLALTQKGI